MGVEIISKRNRVLLYQLVKTDFKLRYQGSFLGILWSVLKPLMIFAVMYTVFRPFSKSNRWHADLSDRIATWYLIMAIFHRGDQRWYAVCFRAR